MKGRFYFSGWMDVDVGDDDEETFLGKVDAALEAASIKTLDTAIPMVLGEVSGWSPICRECGCTDDAACEGGCTWVEEDLCSACVAKAAVP